MLKFKDIQSHAQGIEVDRPACSKVEFIFVCMAFLSSVIMNNQLYNLQMKYHDMAVFLSYIIVYISIGIPLMICSVLLGQFGCTGIILVYRMVPFFRGAGYSMVLYSFMKGVIVSRNIGYSLLVMKDIFWHRGPPMWGNCSNFENLGNCKDKADKFSMGMSCCSLEMRVKGECADKSKLEYVSMEYFVSRIVGNLEESSDLTPHTNAALALCLVWICIYYCLIKSPRSYFNTVPKIYKCCMVAGGMLFFSLVFSEFHLDGFKDMGLNLRRWTDLDIWFESLFSVIHNVEVGTGTLIYLGSYRRLKEDVGRDVIVICILKILNLLCVYIWSIFMVGIVIRRYKATDFNCISKNKELLFLYTGALEGSLTFPAPTIEAALYFTLFTCLELIYGILLIYCVQRSVMEAHPICRRNRKYLAVCLSVIGFSLSLLLINDQSLIIQDLLRNFVVKVNGSFLCIIFALVVFVIYGVDTLCEDYEYVLGQRVMKAWRLMWQLTFPILALMGVYISTKVLPKYRENVKSKKGCFEISVLISVVIMLPIPVFAVVSYVAFAKKENVTGMFQADPSWGPPSLIMRRERRRFDPKNAVRYKTAMKCNHKCLRERKLLKLKRKKFEENRTTFLQFLRSEVNV